MKHPLPLQLWQHTRLLGCSHASAGHWAFKSFPMQSMYLVLGVPCALAKPEAAWCQPQGLGKGCLGHLPPICPFVLAQQLIPHSAQSLKGVLRK